MSDDYAVASALREVASAIRNLAEAYLKVHGISKFKENKGGKTKDDSEDLRDPGPSNLHPSHGDQALK